jgi:hypothetical protein
MKSIKNIWLDHPHLSLFHNKIKNNSLLIYFSPDLKKGDPVQVFLFLKFKTSKAMSKPVAFILLVLNLVLYFIITVVASWAINYGIERTHETGN